METAGILHQRPMLGIADPGHIEGEHADTVGLEPFEIEVEEIELQGVDPAADDHQRHRLFGSRQVEITLNMLAAKRHLDLFERHLEQATRLAIGHVTEQLGLIRQLVILEMGIAGDGVVAHRLEQLFQGTRRITLLAQFAALLEIVASHLAPLVDPVAGHIALDGIEIAIVSTLAGRHGDAGQGLLYFDGISPLPNPGGAAQQAIPAL